MLNQLIIEGNLGADAEVKQIASDLFVVNFSLAQNQMRGGEKRPMWLKCEAVRNALEAANKSANVLKKGRRVVVSGQLLDDSYQKGDDKVKAFKVRVEKFYLMDAPDGVAEQPEQPQPSQPPQPPQPKAENRAETALPKDDLPF